MKAKHYPLIRVFVLLTCLFLAASVHAQVVPEDFFGMKAGNTWNYNGSGSSGTWTVLDQLSQDPTNPTFPLKMTKTYVGAPQDFEWYSMSATEIRLGKIQTWDDVDAAYNFIDFGTGVTWARLPMFVGDTWSTFASGTFTSPLGAIPIIITANSAVEAQENVTVPQGTHKAFRIRHAITIAGLGNLTTLQWAVPYLGMVKRQDTETSGTDTEVLAATTVTLPVGMTFADVPPGHFARTFIEQLATAGITSGCLAGPPPYYCPEESITRGQMAVFIEAALGNAPSACTGQFTDVPIGNPFCGFVERMAADGITSGCGGGAFCPSNPVTRGQMSVFIEAALGHTSTGCTGQFSDVLASNPFCRFIEHLASDGITSGCGVGTYCPDAPVTRAQMAVFLVAAPAPLNP